MIAAGLDLSLTSTGVALIDCGDPEPELNTVKSKGDEGATLLERAERLERIAETIIADHLVGPSPVDLVVIEGPSFGQHRQSGQHDRAGLWWSIVSRLATLGIATVEVSPNSRAKYATGRGNAAKAEVLLCVARRYRLAVPKNDDEADALVLAAMGARALGGPIEDSLPKANLAAMEAIAWSDVIEVPA